MARLLLIGFDGSTAATSIGRLDGHQVVQVNLTRSFGRQFDVDQMFDLVVDLVDDYFLVDSGAAAANALTDRSSLHTGSLGLLGVSEKALRFVCPFKK